MRQNSLVHTLLVLLNLGAVLVALYLAVDAVDAARMQNARVDQSINRLADVLDRLNTTMGRLETSSVGVSGERREAGTSAVRPAASDSFANNDLRDPEAEDGGSVVSRITSLPGSLNSVTTNEATLSSIWGLIIDPLAGRNNNDLTRYEPMLAESWELSRDGLVYTIHLRENALWQPYEDPVTKKKVPAKPVTSRDFLFYWNTIQNTKIPCDPIRTYYEMMDGIEIIDDHTFRVVWKEPYSMSESFTLGMSPLPEHYYRPDPAWDDDKFAEEFISSPRNQWVIGTGPYKLVKWDKNIEVLMERDENYYGPKPPIKSRHMRLIPDNSVSFLEFKRGQLNYYGLLPTQWHEETPEPEFKLVTPSIETAYEDSVEWDRKKRAGELPEDYQFEKYQFNGTSWSYIGYNQQNPLFQDVRVRTALTHLVDRERILDEVLMGLGQVISGPFVPQSPYYNHNVLPLPFDIDEARRILAEAGWEDSDGDGILDKDYDGSSRRKPLAFTLIIPSSSAQIRKYASIIEQDMLKAKIKMEIKPIEWSVYIQALDERNFEACTLAWSGGVEGDPYQIWHGSGANLKSSSNYIAYDSPEANRLIEEGRRTMDKEKRYEIYHRLHEVIAADQPYTFLVAGTATVAQSKNFRNAVVYKGGGMDKLLEWLPVGLQQSR